MNVLVLLPATGGCIDTVAEIILKSEKLVQIGWLDKIEIRTSLSLSADTSDHLNSACPPRVPPRTGSNMRESYLWLLC